MSAVATELGSRFPEVVQAARGDVGDPVGRLIECAVIVRDEARERHGSVAAKFAQTLQGSEQCRRGLLGASG